MSEEKKETAVVRKIWKQNKTTMLMEELWIFQPDLSKDWKLIPKCIYEISEEKYHGDGGVSWREPGISNMAEKK